MSANGDAVQSTVVFVRAMVFALLNGTFDAFVRFAVIHDFHLLRLQY